jgi:hypothetical protein
MKLKIKESIDIIDEIHCQNEHGIECTVDLLVAKNLTLSEIEEVHNLKVGDVIEIPDDTFIYRPLYLPIEFKIIKENQHETNNTPKD